MPNGFWYANHPYDTGSGVAASAFSKGDLLVLDSTSSLSRAEPASAASIVGIALADSVNSLARADSGPPESVYLVPGEDDNLWASLATDISDVTPGVQADVLFATANNRYFVDPSSSNTPRVVVVRGTAGPLAVDQSIQSKVLVRLLPGVAAF